MMLEGFMEPWKLGKTVAEAAIKAYASMGSLNGTVTFSIPFS